MLLFIVSLIYPLFGFLVVIMNLIRDWGKIVEKSLKKYIFSLALFFGVYGYSFSFNNSVINDLTNYFDQVLSINVRLLKYLSLDVDYLYIRDILFYFVNKTGNVHILPFIVGFIIYGIVFYVLFDMVDRSNKKFNVCEVFMLSIISIGVVSPLSIILNVRCILAYVIISFAIYRDLIQKKKDLLTLVMYVLPIFLHSSAIVVLLVRFLSFIVSKLTYISVAIAFLIPTLINIMHSFVNRFSFGPIGIILKNAVNKAYYYLYWNEGGWATEIENSISNKLNRFVGALILVLIVLTILKKYVSTKSKSSVNIIELPMIKYLYLISLFALGCLTIKTGAFWRFESIVVLFSPVLIIQLLNVSPNYNKLFYVLFIISFFMFFLNLVYQIRNLDYVATFVNILTTSGLKILFELLKGIIFIF